MMFLANVILDLTESSFIYISFYVILWKGQKIRKFLMSGVS